MTASRPFGRAEPRRFAPAAFQRGAGFRLAEFLRCLMLGRHHWRVSHARSGYLTCARCRLRRRIP